MLVFPGIASKRGARRAKDDERVSVIVDGHGEPADASENRAENTMIATLTIRHIAATL
jgi:hypothetical protein